MCSPWYLLWSFAAGGLAATLITMHRSRRAERLVEEDVERILREIKDSREDAIKGKAQLIDDLDADARTTKPPVKGA